MHTFILCGESLTIKHGRLSSQRSQSECEQIGQMGNNSHGLCYLGVSYRIALTLRWCIQDTQKYNRLTPAPVRAHTAFNQ